MGRPNLLADDAPEFFERDGHFYVDVGIENAPLLAYSPHLLLKAIERARQAYFGWTAKDDTVVPACGICDRREH